MTVDHGSGITSFPLHTGARKPCNGRADAVGANDQIRRHLDGPSLVVKNDGTTDTAVGMAEQCGQCAAMPDFRPGHPGGIDQRTVQ